MKDNEIKASFIQLRAKGISFAKISKELNVSKPTLINWSREFQDSIVNLKAIEKESLYEKLKISSEHRIKTLVIQLEKIKEELSRRNYSDISTIRLIELQSKLLESIKSEGLTLEFSKHIEQTQLSEFESVETWKV